MIFYQCALTKAEPGSSKETADASWDKANRFDFFYELAKERGSGLGSDKITDIW
jgi:hypothetical protein